MKAVFQRELPFETKRDTLLPGISPLDPREWLIMDEAYAGQMEERERLITDNRNAVIALDNMAVNAALELLKKTLEFLPHLRDFEQNAEKVRCPDGRSVKIDPSDPMATLGRLVQNDFCIMQKRGDEHILTGAVLCFPASWSLSEKFMHPLTVIHKPVAEYDENIARRVQRLFDGIKVERPLWRFNKLYYQAPDLHQPRTFLNPRRILRQNEGKYIRCEKQTLMRLPKSDAVVFTIHTFVLDKPDAPL